MRILLNGLGRIGKSILRIMLNDENIKVIGINELNPNIQNIAYNINFDSTYGRITDRFQVDKSVVYNTKHSITIFNEKNLDAIDFRYHQIDAIIDASGVNYEREYLNALDVKKILITHPSKIADINIITGVNEDQLKNNHKIISTSSCNATALLPALFILDQNFGIDFGEITTIHPFLNHQKLLDGNCIGSANREVECNFEFGRSATENIIPSKTTTIDACSLILPHINADIISSSSFRVPTKTVGVIDATLFLKSETDKQSVLDVFGDFENHQKHPILLNNFDPLVSSDFAACKYTTIIDHRFTDIKKNRMLKLSIWYDNEWGYANKVVTILRLINI